MFPRSVLSSPLGMKFTHLNMAVNALRPLTVLHAPASLTSATFHVPGIPVKHSFSFCSELPLLSCLHGVSPVFLLSSCLILPISPPCQQFLPIFNVQHELPFSMRPSRVPSIETKLSYFYVSSIFLRSSLRSVVWYHLIGAHLPSREGNPYYSRLRFLSSSLHFPWCPAAARCPPG